MCKLNCVCSHFEAKSEYLRGTLVSVQCVFSRVSPSCSLSKYFISTCHVVSIVGSLIGRRMQIFLI